MKKLTQKCIRCGTPIRYDQIDQSKKIYKCLQCNAIASIIIEVDEKFEDYNNIIPSSASMQFGQATFTVTMPEMTVISQKTIRIGCFSTVVAVILITLSYELRMLFFPSYSSASLSIVVPIIAVTVIVGGLFLFLNSRSKVPTMFSISPYNFRIFKEDGKLLYECETYMIDKLIVRKFGSETAQTNANQSYDVLEVLTKDTKLKIAIGQKGSKTQQLESIRDFVHKYLLDQNS